MQKLNFLLAGLALLVLSGVAVALPPDMRADGYLVQVEAAIKGKDKDYKKAAAIMDKIIELKDQHNLEMPIEFYFKYAQILVISETRSSEAIIAITHYLTTTGKNGANYLEALDIYNQVQRQTELKAERQAKLEAEREKIIANMKFLHIPAGSFQMGDIQGGGGSEEQPVHTVTIAQPFYMAKTEVTIAQWQAVMSDNPSEFKGDDRPVGKVSWNDIQAFISKLNQQTGKTYRLPTEAEWEYAARAGSTTKYSWGNYISHSNANYGTDECCKGLARGKDRWKYTAPVASFAPNAFGLYDMHGNVLEWVQDCWNDNYNNAPTDGSAWLAGNCAMRVLRGGDWINNPRWLRSAYRRRHVASTRISGFGFRLIQDRNP